MKLEQRNAQAHNTLVVDDPLRSGEHNDCAVVAHANVCAVQYKEAHATLAACGRRPRRGTDVSATVQAFESAKRRGQIAKWIEHVICAVIPPTGMTYSTRRYIRPTVAQYIRKLPKQGRYMLMAGHHAFSYIDGVLCDNLSQSKMRARMVRCFEITLPAPVVPVIAKFDAEKEQPTQAEINELWARLDKLEGKA